jgi:hypothetical protein
MALISEKLRAIMALDPERAEIDFEGRDYSSGGRGNRSGARWYGAAI